MKYGFEDDRALTYLGSSSVIRKNPFTASAGCDAIVCGLEMVAANTDVWKIKTICRSQCRKYTEINDIAKCYGRSLK